MGRPSPVNVMQSNQANINHSNEQNFDEFLAQAYRLRSVNDQSISVNIRDRKSVV